MRSFLISSLIGDAAQASLRAASPEHDLEGAVRGGIDGTPSFFINGVFFDGDWTDADAFIAALSHHR